MVISRVAGVLFLIGGVTLWRGAAPEKPAKQFLNFDGKKPPGYTQVVTSRPGRMIFISGQGGADEGGKLPADFASQAKNTFENIRRCLAMAGAKFEDVVKINYYVTDMSNTAELRRIRARYLNMDAPPASTLVQVGLGEALLLEVEAIAVVPDISQGEK
jgi:enamine deaminase RidA (YjgF/YER057c/UK114 family)